MSWLQRTARPTAVAEQAHADVPPAPKPAHPTDAEIAAAIDEANAAYVETVPDFGATTECRVCGEQSRLTRTYGTRKTVLESLPPVKYTVYGTYESGDREAPRYVMHEYLTVRCGSCGVDLPDEKPKNYELPSVSAYIPGWDDW
ncbi:hypothetical protein ICV35_25030 [Rhodococcus ruber]|uniref:hypothetical protein n=1 Tax=Rhodococcus ruber TaxID=1830 RepID=UPI00177BEA59|nr:hypothetical protein [Rhodococcus ruber]MBD8056914.1 hypothetical protein [Rhodococcus ruber]